MGSSATAAACICDLTASFSAHLTAITAAAHALEQTRELETAFPKQLLLLAFAPNIGHSFKYSSFV